jgi:broad specificity phosphatase PhoE
VAWIAGRGHDRWVRWPWEEVLLARHGQTEWNLQRRRQGQLDSLLTPSGVDQACRFATALVGRDVDQIFSSPLPRCLRTAGIVSERLRVPVTVIDDLAEVHHGIFAGLTDEEIEERHPGWLARRADDKYRWTFPGGESYADADRRAGRALAEPAVRAAGRPLIVSHEMIGRMLQRHLLGLDPGQALASKHPQNVVCSIRPGRRARETITVEAP